MSIRLWNLGLNKLQLKFTSSSLVSIRNGHHIRGKPPGVARSLEQRLKELSFKDPKIHFKVNIGLPTNPYSRSEQLQLRLQTIKNNRTSVELEKLSRSKEHLINLTEYKTECWKSTGQYQVKQLADHYGIYKHLFKDAYFVPQFPLNISYEIDKGSLPIFYGNIVKPYQATKIPRVTFPNNEDSLWTLILTNPDGHLSDQNSEYVHWFVGNIPGNDISKGETIIEYLQPFPPKGTGYHRYIFILYKQETKIDYSSLKKEGPCLNLIDRTFNTFEFYKTKQDFVTPAGLAFFQSDWDQSLTDFYHKTLNMKEPVYEYDFPKPYIKAQKWFPKRKPFNIYMDKYRDPKQIHKEMLVRKLKNIHPFKTAPPSLPYPNAVPYKGYVPSWLKVEIMKSRLKWGRINDIEDNLS